MDIDKLERFRYVLSLTGMSEQLIQSKTRKHEVVEIRHMLMYFCVTELNMGLKETGLYVGNKDHSTVIHGRDKFRDLLSVPHKGNYEAQRYKIILKKYHEKYGQIPKYHYICADKILDKLTADLIELTVKENQTPIQVVVNNAKKSQLEKYINIVNDLKNEYDRKEDGRTSHIGKTSINVKS